MTIYNQKTFDPTNPPLIIIGTGLAGYHTAKQWRLLDKETPLVIITNDDGAFYSKPQLSTVLARGKTPDALVVKTAEQMAADLDATIFTQTAVASINKEDKIVLLSDDMQLLYRDCVLATGAQVNQLKLDADILSQLFTVNSLQDYRLLYDVLIAKPDAKVVIIGAGLVGSELSNDLVQANYDVTIVALDAWPMQRFLPEKLGHTVQKDFAAHGVKWYLNTSIDTINKCADGSFELQCNDADHTLLKADIIISAIGFRPNYALAELADLAINHGIVVDDRLQTSDPNIYALGDCAELNQTWRPYIAPILHAGKILAEVLAGNVTAKVDYPVMPVIAKTPLCKVQAVFDAYNKTQGYRCELNDDHTRALYYDNDKLKAFALCGDAVTERAKWQAVIDPNRPKSKPMNPANRRKKGDV
jgi:rubredoxin-NAD+ reductase